jgi:hypothetical protein
MRPAFEAAGDIRAVDLLAAFVSLWRQNGSGSLRFSRSGSTAGFDFLEGVVVASHSSQPQFDVAAILARAGKLDPAATERLERPEGGDLAIAALQAGLISGREWKWGQKIRAIEILSDLLGWLEGEYEYDSTSSPVPEDWRLPVPRLVLELFLRSRDRTLIEHYLGPADLPLLRSGRFEEEFETFGLTADAASVVRLIDGRATAEKVAEKAAADEFAVLKLLAALTTLGLVHPAEAALPAGEKPPPPRKRRRDRTAEPVPPPQAPPSAEPEEEAGPAPPSEPEPSLPPSETFEEEAEAVEELPEVPEAVEVLVPETPRSDEILLLSPPRRQTPHEELPVLPFDPVVPPADLMSEPYEPSPPREEPIPEVEPDFRTPPPPPAPPPRATELSFDGGGRGSGGLLAALLGILVIAISVIVVMRSRSGGPETAAAPPPARPTAQDNPVFPPVETAVHLPRRGKPGSPAPATPGPIRTSPAAAVETARPTATPTSAPPTKTVTAVPTRPMPTKSPTRTPTTPVPTKTATRVPTTAVPTKTATPVPTRPAATKTPTPVPTRLAPTKPPTSALTRPAPTKSVPTVRPTLPVPTRPAPPSPVASPSAGPAPAPVAGAARADWIRRAERDREALARRRGARYSVQLELACELETLEKAWSWDKPAGTMWLLTTQYRGRTCFRVLWGHYATIAQAQAARARVPGFFVASGNRPTVVSVR